MDKLTQIIAQVYSNLSQRIALGVDLAHTNIKQAFNAKEMSFFTADTAKDFANFANRLNLLLLTQQKTQLFNLYLTTLTQLCPAQPNMCSTVANSSINLIEVLVLLVNFIKQQFKPLFKGEIQNEDETE